MILWTDFVALAIGTAVVILLPQLRHLPIEAPKFLRVPLKYSPYLFAFLWVWMVLLWATQ